MKLHSEISISRTVLYVSVIISLSGAGIRENESSSFPGPGVSPTGAPRNNDSLMKNLQDTSIAQQVYRLDK